MKTRVTLRGWGLGTAHLLVCVVLPLVAPAQNLSTTNRHALARFWSAIESSNRPVTVLSFGDSMADSYRSVAYHTMNRLISRFGNVGYALNNYRNSAYIILTNGASKRGPDAFWFTEYYQVPPGGAATWGNLPNPNGILADRIGLFYVRHTNGGPFRLLLSTNGGTWSEVLALNGYGAMPVGGFTSLTLPLNRYRLLVETDAGTNYLIGQTAVASQTFGIHAAFIDWPGIALSQVTNVPLAIRTPIFAALNPDLLIWHMKEETTGATSNRMEACEAWWRDAAPDCDVVYIGTPWISVDTNSSTTIQQNTIVRGIALRHQRAFVDLMNPTISYEWLVTNNYMQDPTHHNSAGGLFCANLMWNDLGFFALGLDRRINLQSSGAQLQLSYQTSTNARYHLEFSTNLQSWSAVLTNPVVNASFTTNFPSPPSPAFYRLNLTAP